MTDGLRAELAAHHRRFAPEYGGFLSDHLPMATLARLGLGDDEERVASYAHRYQQRLTPAGEDPGYLARLEHYLDAIAGAGIAATLAEHLPGLISGWVREAYHPLIRIAYGMEFEIAGEVAAGLAYFAAPDVGPDPRIAALAETTTLSSSPPESLFALARGWRHEPAPDETFTQAAQRVIDADAFAEAAMVFSSNLEQVSRVALHAFAATHNFFALHLVTGSHAFRLLYPFAGPHADAICNLGLVAGYAAIGAPGFESAGPERLARPSEPAPSLLELCSEDEHDYKLAYSASRQAAHFDDTDYLAAARAYLSRHRTGN